MLSWLERYHWPLLGLTALLISIGIGVLIDRQFFQGPQPLEIRLDGAPAAEIQITATQTTALYGAFIQAHCGGCQQAMSRARPRCAQRGAQAATVPSVGLLAPAQAIASVWC